MSLRLRLHLVISAIIVALGIWLSSGTMPPYAATDPGPLVTSPCRYLANVDHCHLIAPFRMLAGDELRHWGFSVVLRRILYPIAAYPFVRIGGVMLGGLIANIVFTVGALIGFALWTRNRYGETAAIAVAWLLATYPGITYWAGLPYMYAAIVPATLWAMALLYRIHDAQDTRELVSASAMLGITFLAYDLWPYFIPAAFLVLLWRRRVQWAFLAAVCAAIPTALLALLFRLMSVNVVNSNTRVYGRIIAAWLDPQWNEYWAAELKRLPELLFTNYLYSNFMFLPLLFLGIALFARTKEWIGRPEIALLIVAAALFVFNNAAPPYLGWQMRGDWIARLYQPIFVVFLLAVARTSASRVSRVLAILTVLLNAAIVAGPVTKTPLGLYAYHRFYAHSGAHVFADNLERFGRRPLGLCTDESADWTGPVKCP